MPQEQKARVLRPHRQACQQPDESSGLDPGVLFAPEEIGEVVDDNQGRLPGHDQPAQLEHPNSRRDLALLVRDGQGDVFQLCHVHQLEAG